MYITTCMRVYVCMCMCVYMRVRACVCVVWVWVFFRVCMCAAHLREGTEADLLATIRCRCFR